MIRNQEIKHSNMQYGMEGISLHYLLCCLLNQPNPSHCRTRRWGDTCQRPVWCAAQAAIYKVQGWTSQSRTPPIHPPTPPSAGRDVHLTLGQIHLCSSWQNIVQFSWKVCTSWGCPVWLTVQSTGEGCGDQWRKIRRHSGNCSNMMGVLLTKRFIKSKTVD